MRKRNRTLPPNTCGVLDQCLRRAKNPRVVRRAVAIRAVAAGWHSSDVAEAQGVALSSLDKWIQRFVDEGVNGLVDHPRSGRPSKHTPEQEAELIRLASEDPFQHGVDGHRWTYANLNAELRRRIGVQVSNETVRRILAKYPRTQYFPSKHSRQLTT